MFDHVIKVSGFDFSCLGLQYCCRMVFSNDFADFVQSCYGLVSMTQVAVCLGVVDWYRSSRTTADSWFCCLANHSFTCFIIWLVFFGCELAFLQDLHKLDSVVHANSVYGLLQASFLLAWISTNYAANWFCRLGCSCCRWYARFCIVGSWF